MPKKPTSVATAATSNSDNSPTALSPLSSKLLLSRRPGIIKSLLAVVLVLAAVLYGRLFSTLSIDTTTVTDLQQQQQEQQQEQATASRRDQEKIQAAETTAVKNIEADSTQAIETTTENETKPNQNSRGGNNVLNSEKTPTNQQGGASLHNNANASTGTAKTETEPSSLELPSNEPTPEQLEKLQECFSLNSKEWLRGPRHGNIQQDNAGMDQDFIANMILFGQTQYSSTTTTTNDPGRILQQSMCHAQSRFLNASDSQMDDRSIELWIVRLAYMAIHKLQHQFAAEEALHRMTPLQSSCQTLAKEFQIGSFDYECPKGRFFIIPIENLGLGAVMRTTVLSGYLAALATDRAVLFVNHAPSDKADRTIQTDWYHASCPRFDVQCFYHPPSPCVLTLEQLETATMMTGFKNSSKLFKNPNALKKDEWFDKAQSVIFPSKTVTRRVPKNIPHILRNFTLDFMNGLPEDDVRRPVLEQVAARFVSNVYHEKVNQLISYGLVFYAMRPHLKSQEQLHQVMEKVLATTKSYTPETTFGLPIRASDKCVQESECLSFEQYMQVMTQIWNRNKTNLTQAMNKASVDKISIILTTESASVIEEKDAFMADADHVRKIVPFPFDFILNNFDIQQDSGNPKDNLPEHNMDVVLEENSADQVMLSMVSSLQLQLLARHSRGNCCSNFHRILFELLDGGCGASYDRELECLNYNEDPNLRICCLWDQTEECKAKHVKEKIEQKWKEVKQRRMRERRRRKEQLENAGKGEQQ